MLSTNTQELVASFRVTTGTSNTTAIKSIEFARKGRWESGGSLTPSRGVFGLALIVLLVCPGQLLPHKHGRSHHQGVRRQGDPDVWARRRARTHAEAAGPREQVRHLEPSLAQTAAPSQALWAQRRTLLTGLRGSAAASPGMASTSWPARPGSMPSTSGRRALETW